MLHVFVSAAWSSAARVRDLHEVLTTRMACSIQSTWADAAAASEGQPPAELDADSSDAFIEEAWRSNRDGIIRSHVVLVLADTPTREGHAEAEYARIMGKAIIWVGKPTLTSRRFKYFTCATEHEALEFLVQYGMNPVVTDYIKRGQL